MIYCIIYFIIGIILGFYWWKTDYVEEYEEAKANNDVEEGMAVLLILFLIVLWPLFFIHKLIKILH